MAKVLGVYDGDAIRRLFEEAGVLTALMERGFHDFEVRIDDTGLPHTQLLARKRGQRWLLLDACVTETVVQPDFFRARDYPVGGPVRLALLYWLREEDPTAHFDAGRPPLPLQRYPGLGVLRSAFRVITHAARARGLDGVACVPKFFHDAVIFFHARLFLFLDGNEQGRFEALLRDAGALPLATAAARLGAGAVGDAAERPVVWSPGLQVYPVSPALTAYFHSPQYVDRVRTAREANHFTWAPPSASDGLGAASQAYRNAS